MSAEKIQPKDTLLSTFADSCATLLLALGTPATSLILDASNIAINDIRIGLISLVAGEGLAIASFVTGRIINRTGSEDNLPKKPLSAENSSSRLTRLTTASVTS